MRKQSSTNGIHVRLQDGLLRAIENFRRCETDIPSKPEAVRRLLQRAVMALARQENLQEP